MNPVCPICSQSHPPGAQYCSHAPQEADADRSLGQLVEKPTTDSALHPKLGVEPDRVSLNQLEPGKDDTFDLVIVNHGAAMLSGSAVANCDWLLFDGQPRTTFETKTEICIPVRVVGARLRAGVKPLEGEITVESNGGAVKIPVVADIAVRPFPSGVLAGATKPRDIATKALANVKEAALLFDQGAVKAWYESNGWIYPIVGPAATGPAALQQFGEVLGMLKPPSLTLDTDRVQLTGKAGERLKGQVVLSTQETAPLFAHAESEQAWVVPAPPKLKAPKALIVPFDVVVPQNASATLEGTMTIKANGNQRFIVHFSLSVAGKSAPAPSAPTVPMGLPPKPVVTAAPAPAPTVAPPSVLPSTSEPAPVPPVATMEGTPVVSSSGKRLTTLVREAVETAVEKTTVPRRGINELSVLSLTLGLIALAIAWPFALGGAGMMLGLGGLVASAAALGLLWKRQAGGFTLPAVAALICLQAFTMSFILWLIPPKPTDSMGGYTAIAAKPNFPAIGELKAGLKAGDPAEKKKAVAAVGELATGLQGARVDLLTALQDGDEAVRLAAIEALEQIGPPARVLYSVLDALAETDPSEKVRKQAELATKKINAPSMADLSELLGVLKHPDPGLRSAAALGLGYVGLDGRDAAVGDLKKLLGDKDIGVRVSAAQALWVIPNRPTEGLVPALTDGLKDKSRPDVRARAAGALGAILAKTRVSDDMILDVLEAAMFDDDAGVRIAAVFALGNLDAARTPEKFRKALGDTEVKVQIIAAQALWKFQTDAAGVSKLVAALRHKDADIKVIAAEALWKFGKEAKPAVTPLAWALKDSDARVRGRAAKALFHIGPDAREAVPALREVMRTGDAVQRAQAAHALSGIGTAAREATPELNAALLDAKDAEVQLFAARALWIIDQKTDKVLPVMIKVLKEEKKDAVQRARAADMIGGIGSRAHSALPQLHEALHDKDAGVRAAAVRGIAEIGGPMSKVAYPAIAELSKEAERDASVRAAASDALKKIGRPSKADVETLASALSEKYPARFRAGAAVTLWLMDKEAKKAVGALGKCLEDKDDTIAEAAAFALAAMGPDAADAVGDLRNALKNEDEGRRSRAALALGQIGTGASEAVADLNKLLVSEEESATMRFQAARALWAIKKQTKDVLPVIVLALKSEDPEWPLQASELLSRIVGEVADAKGKKGLPAELKKELDEQVVPQLIKLLPDGKDRTIRAAATAALGALALDARPSIPLLLQVLEDEDPDLRSIAADALGRIGAAEMLADKKNVWTKTAYPALLFYSKVDPNEKVQRAAKTALDKIGGLVPEDVALLINLLKDKSQSELFRNAAGQVLGMIGAQIPKGEIARLGELLKTEDNVAIKSLVAYALGEVGPPAITQSKELLSALKSPDPILSAAAAYALGEVYQKQKAPEVRAALQEAIESGEEAVIAAARTALSKIAP